MAALQELDRLRIGDELHARFALPSPEPVPNLADALYDLLWKRIVNLEFPAGTRLSEEALAREVGVSRTPVREALLRLGHVGLVRVSARRGMTIPTVTRQDVIELYDLRTALETYAARRAAASISGEEIAVLRERQRLAHERAASDSAAAAEAFFHADLALHEVLQKHGGNRRTARLLADVMGQLSLLSLRAAQTTASRLAAIAEHRLILDALAHQDAAGAADAMEAHIQAVKARSLADLERLSTGS